MMTTSANGDGPTSDPHAGAGASPVANADDEAGTANTPGGQDQERVEDRPSVGTVSSDDYPKDLPDH